MRCTHAPMEQQNPAPRPTLALAAVGSAPSPKQQPHRFGGMRQVVANLTPSDLTEVMDQGEDQETSRDREG